MRKQAKLNPQSYSFDLKYRLLKKQKNDLCEFDKVVVKHATLLMHDIEK